MALADDIQNKQTSLKSFKDVCERLLVYIPEVLSSKKEKDNYVIFSSEISNTLKFLRPVNRDLFIWDVKDFNAYFKQFEAILTRKNLSAKHASKIIDKTLYTLFQSFALGMDLLINPNSARKHIGNRFEELIRLVVQKLNISLKKIVLTIPYESVGKQKYYRCETDFIFSKHRKIKSNNRSIHNDEIVVSLKTTSKDRMGKIFLDKILMERFVGHPIKLIAIFFNDVQRKEECDIGFTLVSGLFMVYTKFLSSLEGVYYIDPPPVTKLNPYNKYIFPFSKFILEDIYKFL